MTTFEQQLARIKANALRHEQRMVRASRTELEVWGDDAEASMKANAPWTDRTGEARDRLSVAPDHPPVLDGGAVVLTHQADHGFYLETKRGHRDPLDVPTMEEALAVGGAVAELANGSEWAVLQPTVAAEGPALTRRLKEKVWK